MIFGVFVGDTSYPNYYTIKVNGKKIFDLFVTTLTEHSLGGHNLTANCLNCHRQCGPHQLFCNVCLGLIKLGKGTMVN